ncbi:MAG: MerR family transcriptional regulator [Elusimicrobia bacterium]|nr:MerR family transcriptional regulator [Elusimicrobiota bacterium]
MKKYFTIGEVSERTDIPAYTLRYWESEFKLLRPLRRESGQRRYTQSDLHTVEKIKKLLYEKKYSIAGAKKQLIQELKSSSSQMEFKLSASGVVLQELKKVEKDLLDIKKMLSES